MSFKFSQYFFFIFMNFNPYHDNVQIDENVKNPCQQFFLQ